MVAPGEVAIEDAGEQNSGDTQRNAADLDRAQGDARGDHDAQDQDQPGDAIAVQQGSEPGHGRECGPEW